MEQYPKNFFWGCSTASHQIEGNTYNDWSKWELTAAKNLAKDAPKAFSKRSPIWDQVEHEARDPQNYISGIADDSYNRWREDIELLKQLGVNAYRFSIEWSRIEPEFGHFNMDAIEHYKEIIRELRKNKIEPFVTLVHRTIPVWFAKNGGWAYKDSVRTFARYAKILAENFDGLVSYWTPLNEPVLNVSGGFLVGIIPPNRKGLLGALKAYNNMIQAHNWAYSVIKSVNPKSTIGCAHAAVYAEAEKDRWYNRVAVSVVHYLANWKFFNGIRNHTDFIGIQYYTRGVLGFRSSKYLIPFPREIPQPGLASDMGQEIYPEGLYKYAKMVWNHYGKPIIVTENGIADRNDAYRSKFITEHINEVENLLRDGVDIRGYFHWSLLDNFEWDKGFWPRFGLAEVDRTTLKRTSRGSAQTYIDIIKNAKSKTE